MEPKGHYGHSQNQRENVDLHITDNCPTGHQFAAVKVNSIPPLLNRIIATKREYSLLSIYMCVLQLVGSKEWSHDIRATVMSQNCVLDSSSVRAIMGFCV